MKFEAGKRGYRTAVFHVEENTEIIAVCGGSEEWANKICAALNSFYEDEEEERDTKYHFGTTEGSSGWSVEKRSTERTLILDSNLTEDEARKAAARLNGLLGKGGE